MPTTATRTRAGAERRTVTLENVQLRELDDGRLELTGAYAAVFDVPSRGLRFIERIMPGAFTDTLAAGPDVRLLAQHDPSTVMARTIAGDLFLTQDVTGLGVRALLDPTDPDVIRLVPKLRNGHITGMSFAFWVNPGGEERVDVDGVTERHLTSLDLDGGDVAIVTYPAYPDTTSGELRSLADLAVNVDARAGGALGALPDDLSDTAVRTVLERLELRALELTHGDALVRLSRALDELLGGETWDFYYWIRDVADDWIVFRAISYGDDDPLPTGYWQLPYTIDDAGAVTFDTWTEVVPRTVYDPVPAPPAGAGDENDTVDGGEAAGTGDTTATMTVDEARARLHRRHH